MSPEQEKIDKFLDTALRSYSEVEPRVGFEARILAYLRTTPIRPQWQMRLVYASAAMVMVGAVLYGIWRKELAVTGIPSQPSPATVASHVKALDVAPVPEVAISKLTREQVVKQVRTRPNRTRRPSTIVGLQLPASRPLSNQERLLLAFARDNPKEVVSTIEWQEQMRRPPEPVSESDRGEQQ